MIGIPALPLSLALVLAAAAPAPHTEPPPPRSAEIDETLTIGGEEIAARKVRSRMTVEVHINEQGPYRFVVDSGADSSVVSRQLADTLALPLGTPAMIGTVTEIRPVDRVEVESLRLGPTTTHYLEVPVLEAAHIGGDGLIGLDALVQQRLMLDFERKVITVDDGRTAPTQYAGEIVVTGRLRRGQLILTQVTAGAVRLEAIVDTGSEITIGNTALRDQLVKRGRAKFGTVRIYGVTGTYRDVEYATVPRLKVGSVVMENVPVAFADIPPFALFGMRDKPGLLLGTDVMELFRRVSLDFHARKVRFQLRSCDRTLSRVRTMTSPSRLSSQSPESCAR